jgi:DUF4097 and DUF4098 domain-containing protein YvlB
MTLSLVKSMAVKPSLVKAMTGRSSIAAAAALLLSAAAPSCSRTYFVESRFVVELGEEASRTENAPLTFKAGDSLAIDLPAGPVSVKASPSGHAYTARITARGKTKEEAEKNLAAVKILADRSSGGVSIRVETDSSASGTHFTSVNLDVAVPEKTALDLRTGTGDVRVHGPVGACAVDTSYGAVQVREAAGGVRVVSKSGAVAVERVSGAPSVQLKSGYGAVKATDCKAERVELESSSGDVTAVNIDSPSTNLSTRYGRVEVRRVAGAVDVKTNSGDVLVEEAAGGSVEAESGFGTIRVRGAVGPVRVKTSSGQVEATDCQGPVEASSNYGNVKISGALTTVQARSNSGGVAVEASAKSAPAGAWTVTSGYGAVVVSLPASATGNLDARTNYGTVVSEFPVLLEPGVKSKDGVLRGVLNPQSEAKDKGAAAPFTLTATSSSGDVKIRRN